MRLRAALAIALCAWGGAASAQTIGDPIGDIFNGKAAEYRGGPVRWTTNRATLKPKARGAAVDTLRVRVGEPLNVHDPDANLYELSLTRDWPAAFSLEAGDYDLDLTPHAGLGVSSAGGQAEAGARVTVGQRVEDRLKSLGVTDGAAFGNQGRWYLFAAASGRAVGLNMLRNNGDWDRAGWTTDPASQIVGDAQVGVGWRKGALESSFGYIHREVNSRSMLLGQEGRDDSMVAFSLSIKPR